MWYLSRGTFAGGGFGAVLGLLLVLYLSGMGDAPVADDVRDMIPYVLSWAIMGFVLDCCGGYSPKRSGDGLHKRHGLQIQKETAWTNPGGLNEVPATAYSPASSRTEYHRRCRA